jgi:RNA polymerase sigma-70 factor (ECF subfamily)
MKDDILASLYNSQAPLIYRYLLKHGCRREVAEEIVHDSFIRVIEHFNDINLEIASSWIFRVTLNGYRSYLKKASTREELLIEETRFLKNFSIDADIEEVLLNNEKKKEIGDCLNSLKESYKELLILKYEMELSYKDIGAILGISEKNVKTYLYRARNKFKSLWRDIYE